MSLHVEATILERDVDVTFDVADGETLAILGPNGAGKSSVLSAIAGILRPDAGRATLGDDVLFGSGIWKAPHTRGTALLSQDALLFPQLDVTDNVAFGPRSAGHSRAESRVAAARWLTEVDASELADLKPSQLSGGQAQRIGVARALAAEPRLLLLDEPMAALDITVVPAMRQMLKRVLAERTAIIVTHDALDAALLADRVIVMDRGRIVEAGATKDVLAKPRSQFGAQIAGLNLLRGIAEKGGVRTAGGSLVEGMPNGAVAEAEAAVAVFSPSAVSVYLEHPSGSPRNVFAATVTELEPIGAQVRVRTAEVSADITVAAVADLQLMPGTMVFLSVKASEVAIYD